MHVPSVWNIAEHAEHVQHHHHLCQLSEKAGKKERGLAPSLLTY